MLQATIDTQEAERKRIGANLHDDLGPLLSTVKMYFRQVLTSCPNHDEKEASELQGALNEAIDQLRSVSHDMVSSVLETFGLYAAIHELVDRLERLTTMNVTFTNSGEALEMEDRAELALYRIVQESVNNIIKHANASTIEIRAVNTNESFQLSIVDDGHGFDTETLTAGLGLQNIRARANAIGATLDIDSEIGNGSKIIIWLKK